MNFDEQIAAANQRLKAQKARITIIRKGQLLSLRGTFPPRTGSGKPTRGRIPLNISATPQGLKRAESKAVQIRMQIDSNTFDWADYIEVHQTTGAEPLPTPDHKKTATFDLAAHDQNNLPLIFDDDGILKPQPKLVSDWIRDFEQYYFSRRARTSASLLTWKKDYLSTFRKLNPDQPLTALAIEQAVLSTPADTRVRQRCCICFNALAKFANIETDLSQWVGNYSPKRLKPRNIPDDKLITKHFYTIADPAWKWCVGMLATYGLRNHELFRVNHLSIELGNPIITVDEGKTGFRIVYPIYPEWFEQFQLQTVILPPVNCHNSNESLGHTVSQAFRRMELPFRPYDLRHAWAIRSLLFGLDVSLAAQMMGHSLRVHHDTYHHWITEGHYERAFQLLMERSDRPRPPGP